MSKFFLFCVPFLLVSSALSQDVVFHFDDTADFSKFKTYKWITLEKVAPIDKLTDEQISASLDAALARKGLTKVGGETADLLIGFQTTEREEEELPGFDPDTGLRTDFGVSSNSSWTIYKGQLVVSMFDAANRKVIWRGVASKTLDPKANANKRQKSLNKAVAKLMKNYPPPK